MSVTTSATWMCNFIIGLVTPDMLQTIKYGTYFFVSIACSIQGLVLIEKQFAAFCLLAFAFTWIFVPETKGKSLEDMDLVFGDSAAHTEKAHLVRIARSLQQENQNVPAHV
jgi:hypothetical protein